MLNKKSIVLNGVEDNSERAVLTLESDGDMINGRLRLYNFGIEPKGIITLGINDGKSITKAGLTHSSGMLFTFKSELKQIPEKFTCAVINFVGGEPKPLLYGSSEGYIDKEKVFDSAIKSLSASKNIRDVEEVLDRYDIDYDETEKEEIENSIEQAMKDYEICDKKCDNCEYKKFYFSHIRKMEDTTIDENIDKVEERVTNKFYQEMKKQIDSLFEDNPSEDYLEQLIPDSKWVKVNIDSSGDYYVLGLIYENEKLKYICYGVPGVYQKFPPRELSGYPIWFPLDEGKPEGFGYWLSYQDADSGESVKAIII